MRSRAAGRSCCTVPTGHILFRKNPVENPSLWALPFSTTTLTALGDPFMIERSGLGASLADDGTLVYLDNVSRGQQVLAWRDRSGKLLGKATEGHEVIQLARLSPDGDRAVATAIDPGQSGLWIYDVQRFVKTRLLTESQSSGNFVLFGFWSRRGDEIHYSIGDPARLSTESSVRPADGPETPRKLAFPQGFTVVQDATTDGRYVVAGHSTDGRENHIWFWRKGDNGNAETVDFSKNTEAEQVMTLSPSGRFIAYTSTVGDRIEVYVRPFPEGPGRWQISTNGGGSPRWSRDGTELFFVEGNTLKRASVSTGAQFSAGATATLFESPLLRGGPAPFARYDVSPDGRKFLTVEYQRDIAQPLVRIVENWLPDFRTRQTK